MKTRTTSLAPHGHRDSCTYPTSGTCTCGANLPMPGEESWDEDDRKRCVCIANHRLKVPYAEEQCLNLTRHPSGMCADCRRFPGGRKVKPVVRIESVRGRIPDIYTVTVDGDPLLDSIGGRPRWFKSREQASQAADEHLRRVQ